MPHKVAPEIVAALEALPEVIKARSGAIFYSSMVAFEGTRPLYILGLNPGGDPDLQSAETIGRSADNWLQSHQLHSAYVDELWGGHKAGHHGMQPRIRHMFKQISVDLHQTPASNIVFVRTRTEASLRSDIEPLRSVCWPVHDAVITTLNVRVLLCLGKTAGRWVRDKLGAHQLIDRFVEQNGRNWLSTAHSADDGRVVITVTHPSRANWCKSVTDPSAMVIRVLSRVASG